MRMLVCSVFDTKVGAYASPHFFRSRGEAVRSFMDAVLAEGSPFGRHRGDYRFFLIGEWDDQTAVLVAIPPEPLLGADEVGPPAA